MVFLVKKWLLLIPVMLTLVACKADRVNAQKRSYLNEGWRIFSSASVTGDGVLITSPGFDRTAGYPVTLPATVMHGLMQNELFPDIFAPGVLEEMDRKPYQVPWWYRRELQIDALGKSDFYRLTFEGINYKANIWLNGTLIASADTLQGSYGIWDLDITRHLKRGANLLAVEVIPPVFGVDVSMGFVDWNPTPPDQLMGLWRGVLLTHTGPVSMSHSNVVTTLDKMTLQRAEVTFTTELTNQTDEPQQTTLTAAFNGVTLTQQVLLEPNETREVCFKPGDHGELQLTNPRLWWPNNMGEQPLYDLTLTAMVGERESDSESFRFGIREIEDYWNEAGYRGFMVNGQKVMLRSAGWVDDIFLGDSDEKVKAMVKYAKHMNLNSLRLEGFWGRNRTLLEMADECGLLLMHGWSAHWEWDSYNGIPHDEYVSIRGEEAMK
ncbi:MAG: glycoside hydrolase family 2, partial [Proteiniphilum sp.]|nr:glycoside hydrolase family 2 [Proteiniphilum sp.]